MKIVFYIFIGLFILGLGSCQKWDYYKTFVPNGEKKYPSIDSAFRALPGHDRIQLVWKHVSDPTVEQYIILWNNKADSTLITNLPNVNDTIKHNLALSEGVYEFTIHSIDAFGNRSVPRYVSGARSYGERYISLLYNRTLLRGNNYSYDANGDLIINFNSASTEEVYTEILYTNTSNANIRVLLDNELNSIKITNHKTGTNIRFKSIFKPNIRAIDEFSVPEYSILVIQ